MNIPFIGGAYTDWSPNLNAQTCINLFPVIDNKEAKNVLALYGTPGLEAIVYFVSRLGYPIRGMYSLGDYLYVVTINSVWRFASDWSYTYLGALTTYSNNMSMADNGLQIMMVDGVTGYIITVATGALSTITDPDFPVSTSVTFQDGYFIVTEKDTGYFYISALYDGTSWDSTDKANAEGRSDTNRTIISNTHDLWIFGKRSIEVYYNSGNADFPFERIQGALIDVGCGAASSAIKIGGRLYWLTDQKRVARSQGYQYEFISTPHIDYQFSKYSTIEDAIAYTYTYIGHQFYVLSFPSEDKTWVYDLTTDYWHEWKSYKGVDSVGRHRGNCSVLFGTDWYVGDYTNSYVYKVNGDYFSDDTHTIIRQRAAQTINKERVNVLHHKFELDFESGVGLSGGVQGEDPQVILDWSDDGGHTWSNQHWTSIGKIGEYKNRAIWRRLGRSRNRIYRTTISDPVKVVIVGAYAELEALKA